MKCHSVKNYSPPHDASHANKVLYSPLTAPDSQTTTPTSLADPKPTFSWGPFVTAQGTASTVFSSFCAAIFIHFDNAFAPIHTNAFEPSKVAAAYNSMGCCGDENLVHYRQNIMLTAGGTLDDADELIKIVYDTHRIEYVMTTRQAPNPVWHGTPAMTKGGFERLLFIGVVSDPEAEWRYLNNLLKAIPTLKHPETGDALGTYEIPRRCFPEKGDEEVVAALGMKNDEMVQRTQEWSRRWKARKVRDRELEILRQRNEMQASLTRMQMMQNEEMCASLLETSGKATDMVWRAG